MKPIVSISKAREILGRDAETMTDEEILQVVETLHSLAKDAIEDTKTKLKIKKDAKDLANLIYDVYQDKVNPGGR